MKDACGRGRRRASKPVVFWVTMFCLAAGLLELHLAVQSPRSKVPHVSEPSSNSQRELIACAAQVDRSRAAKVRACSLSDLGG